MIYKDTYNQDLFDKNGYTAHNLLDETELNSLKDLYRNYLYIPGEVIDYAQSLGYYISVFDKSIERKQLVDASLKKILTPKINEILNAYTILTGNFMTKEPGGKEIEVHQDFSFVDEKMHTAFNLWIPLQDTSAANGGLFVLEGSHRLFNSHRSATIPHNLTHYHEQFKPMMNELPVKAGEGLLFDHKLFHYSSVNASDQVRVAVQVVLIPKQVTPRMYYYDPKTDSKNLTMYAIDENYLLNNNLWEKPHGLKDLGKVPYEKIPDAEDILYAVKKQIPINTGQYKFIKTIKKCLEFLKIK